MTALRLYDCSMASRLLLGTANYPSPAVMQQAVRAAGAAAITLSLKRQLPAAGAGDAFWAYIRELGLPLLPNTAGCRSAREAVSLAQISRELFATDWIKLEVIGDDYNLQPHPQELVKAAERLLALGFKVFPYCTDDLVLCRQLVAAGCQVLMPWAAPIGSGRGVQNPYQLRTLRERLPDVVMIVDAGLGRPSDACQVMEMGFDGVLLNTAVAEAGEPVAMACAFAEAIRAGRSAFMAGMIPRRDMAKPSTPVMDEPLWRQ